MQVDCWTNLKKRGDWVIERRYSKNPPFDDTVPVILCVIDPSTRKEESVELPQDLLDILVKGGATIQDSHGWE